MPSPTPPLPTTCTAPSNVFACTCAFALSRVPITSSKRLCHALSHYPEITGMVVEYWNGESRIRRDMKGFLGYLKGLCKDSNPKDSAAASEEFYDCAVELYLDELTTILGRATSIFEADPTSHTLTLVLRFFSAAIRFTYTHWTPHTTHYGIAHYSGYVEVEDEEVIGIACRSLAAVIQLYRTLARSQTFEAVFPLIPPFVEPLNPVYWEYRQGITPLLRVLGCFDIHDVIDDEDQEPEVAYWTLPWEAAPRLAEPRPPSTSSDGSSTTAIRITMSHILSASGEGEEFDPDWNLEESGAGDVGLVLDGHGYGWST